MVCLSYLKGKGRERTIPFIAGEEEEEGHLYILVRRDGVKRVIVPLHVQEG